MNYSCPNNLIEIKQGIKNNITKNTQCDIKRKINAGILKKEKCCHTLISKNIKKAGEIVLKNTFTNSM